MGLPRSIERRKADAPRGRHRTKKNFMMENWQMGPTTEEHPLTSTAGTRTKKASQAIGSSFIMDVGQAWRNIRE